MQQKLAIKPGAINLVQVLKFSGLAESGAHAKALVADGTVRVNGEVELRMRRQLAVGDLVQLDEGPGVELVGSSHSD